MPCRSPGQQLFHGILPIDEVEGNYAEVLGNFPRIHRSTFLEPKEFSRERTLPEWQTVLRRLVERFFASDEFARELYQIRDILDSVRRQSPAEADFY